MKNTKNTKNTKGTKKASGTKKGNGSTVRRPKEKADLPAWNQYFIDFRIERNLSQTKFGELTGIGSKFFISDIEGGRRSVTLQMIEKVEKAFNLELYEREAV